jgi:hypothetical protein
MKTPQLSDQSAGKPIGLFGTPEEFDLVGSMQVPGILLLHLS